VFKSDVGIGTVFTLNFEVIKIRGNPAVSKIMFTFISRHRSPRYSSEMIVKSRAKTSKSLKL